MIICTVPKVFKEHVDSLIEQYETAAKDPTYKDIDSSYSNEELKKLYAFRKAIEAEDYDYIRSQGYLINTRKEQAKLASSVFVDTFGSAFLYENTNGTNTRTGLFEKIEMTDGGVAVHFTHEGKDNRFVFSLTSDSQSAYNKDNKAIKIPGFRKFLDDYVRAEEQKMALHLVLGNDLDEEFKLDGEFEEKSYAHGSVENMKNMLRKIQVLGGNKADEGEMGKYFDIIDRMKPEFFNKLKLYVQSEADKSKGVVTPKRIDIKINGAPAIVGNQQSEASIYMEEVLHSMTMGAINSKTPEAAKLKQRLDRLVELGRKQLTPKDFLPEEKDSVDKEKEAIFAERLYEYIFNNKNTSYEFLAKGIAQPEVAKALSKVKLRDHAGEQSLLDRFMDFFERVIDIITGNIGLKDKSTNVHDSLVTLAYDMGEINTRKNRELLAEKGLMAKVLDIVLNDTDRKLSRTLHNLSEKAFGDLANKAYKKIPEDSDIYGRVKAVAGFIGLSMVNPTYTKVMGSLASAYGMKPDSTIREIISGLYQTEPVQRIAEFVVLQSGYVDRKRNEQINLTRDSTLSMFSDPKNLARSDEEALTSVLADTDLGSLFGKSSVAMDSDIVKSRVYDNARIRKLLTDEKTLDSYIKDVKRSLKFYDDTHYNWHSNQAVGLGIYMATHQGIPGLNVNAENIAKGFHSSHSKKANKNVVKAVDELATLVAIKNTDKVHKDAVAALMKDEWKGVQHVADVVEGLKKNSDETVFKGSKVNKIKGYTREIFDDTKLIAIDLLANRKDMEAQGFTFRAELQPKVGDKSKRPLALYVTDTAARPDRLRGGVRLNQIKSKGVTVTDAAYIEGEGFSNRVIRENSQREINEIQKVAEDINGRMEKGEFDFKDVPFGVMPLMNEQGKVVDYRHMMSKETKKELLKQDTRISEVMARSFGTLLDKQASADHNNEALEVIKQDMYENWEQGTKGIDGLTDFTLIGPEVADKEMRKLFYMLPKTYQDFIKNREDKTMAVRTSLKNLYFGYTHKSVMDIPGLSKITPQLLERGIRILESIWMEIVQIAKTNILLKMPTVMVSNFVSNVIYLTMKGYNPVDVVKMQMDSYRAIKKYNADSRRKQEVVNSRRDAVIALRKVNLPESRIKELRFEIKKADGELKALESRITDSRIHELVQLGLDQTVEDLASSVTRDTNRVSKFFDEKLENVPDVARTGLDYMFLTKRTVPYKVANEFLEITDLMSRDIQNTMEIRAESRQVSGKEDLPQWWLDKQKENYPTRKRLSGEEKTRFLKEAKEVRQYDLVEDFVNYALPSSSFEEYLNKVGILMFTKYVKRIQRIIAKTGGRGPIKTLLGVLTFGFISDLPTIHEQSLFVKDWYGDSLGPGNVFPIYSPIDTFMNVVTPSILKASTYDVLP